MGWFQRTQTDTTQTKSSDDLWAKCGDCATFVLRSDWETNLRVCARCGYHAKFTAQERIDMLLDPGSFSELHADIIPGDPLGFSTEKSTYRDQITAARKKTGLNESVVTGSGKIKALSLVISVMDFRFLGGSLGSGTGEKILQGANVAHDTRTPYVVISSSGGARMQEGMLSLMQMAKTCAGIARLHDAKIPYISILTDPTTGGVSASFAMVGDLNIAEPHALIGFAGRRVIEQTIRQKLPDDFQTAEYLLHHGFIDMIVERKHLRDTLHKVLSYSNR
jgi:acetyl-CoA carboxylase carboxyl transferase subunit beta